MKRAVGALLQDDYACNSHSSLHDPPPAGVERTVKNTFGAQWWGRCWTISHAALSVHTRRSIPIPIFTFAKHSLILQ
jgi:hypothetical protein